MIIIAHRAAKHQVRQDSALYNVYRSARAAVVIRGVNLGGRGDTSPQNLEWGTPMYNVPRFYIFPVFFPYSQRQPYFCNTCKTEIVQNSVKICI